ncbi:MAG: carboxypeptidase regulatory-like domain-containing protein [Acidobacteria bacterium]|nr:carboxypeptidase regulatory-like domain-containing protein [Acidobacteriota bacterium]
MKKAIQFCALLAIGALVYANIPQAQAASAALGSIRGFIKDGQGNPLIGASVFVLSEAEASAIKIIKRASTDKEGKFLAVGLLPGRYLLKAEATGFAPIAFPADVQPRKVIVFDSILMRREGTLAEKTSLNLDPKFAARRSRGSIFHLDENKSTTAEAEDDQTIALTPRSDELHGFVHAFNQTAVSNNSELGSMTGVNFAVAQQIGRDANVVLSGQLAHGEGAMQRFEALTTGHAGDKHKLSLALGYARFTFSRHNRSPQIGQFSLSATDTWQVAGPVLVVYGLEFARFTDGASATSVLPRFGIAIDAGARTRLFAGLTPGASVDEQAKVNLESGEIIFSQPKTPALSPEGAPMMDSSYRLQVGTERILSDKSSVEVMAFFDTVSGHGIGLLAIPFDRVEDDSAFYTAPQKGRARGLRVVYNRRLNKVLDTSVGYACGEGQELNRRGITDPAHLFANRTFQIVAARINANFISTGTRISTVLRIAPTRAVFAIDPFAGQMATYDPNLSISINQSLPTFGLLPGQLEAVVDVRNLLDQQATVADERQQLISSRFNRLVRVGLSMRF